ncbi:hypothetical protein OIU74_026116, partial [Salix koriyanagi]
MRLLAEYLCSPLLPFGHIRINLTLAKLWPDVFWIWTPLNFPWSRMWPVFS